MSHASAVQLPVVSKPSSSVFSVVHTCGLQNYAPSKGPMAFLARASATTCTCAANAASASNASGSAARARPNVFHSSAARASRHAAVSPTRGSRGSANMPRSVRSRVESIVQRIQNGAAQIKAHAALGGGSHAEETPDKNAYLNALEECVAKLAALADNKALATGTYSVDQTTHASSFKSANAHERGDANDVAHSRHGVTAVAAVDELLAVAAPAMVIDKFPAGLTQKNLARLEKMAQADGVAVHLIRGGVPCFSDKTNGDKVSWLPPRWSQEKIQGFLSKQCRVDVSKLLVRASPKSPLQNTGTGADTGAFADAATIECEQSGDEVGAAEGIEAAPAISYFETDAFKKVAAVISLALRAFNVVMATLLSVFVPQTCDPIVNSPDVALRERHDCTMAENFTDLIALNQWALALNFASLAAYLALFFIQYKRERFIVDYLEIDEYKPLEHLPAELREPSHSQLRLILRKLNFGMLSLSVTAVVLSIVNVALSAWLIFFYSNGQYYAGTRSVTVMITNLLLLVTVVTGAVNNAWVGLHTEQALSCVAITPVSFNCVDDDDEVLEKERLLDAQKYDFCGIGAALLDGFFPLNAAK